MLENIKLAIFFGSKARGTSGAMSDFDVAILGDHPLSLEERQEAARAVSLNLKASEDQIDLVDLWDAPPLLQYAVANQGKLIHGNDYDFLRFQVLAWKRYCDTAKFRRVRDNSLAKQYGGRNR